MTIFNFKIIKTNKKIKKNYFQDLELSISKIRKRIQEIYFNEIDIRNQKNIKEYNSRISENILKKMTRIYIKPESCSQGIIKGISENSGDLKVFHINRKGKTEKDIANEIWKEVLSTSTC